MATRHLKQWPRSYNKNTFSITELTTAFDVSHMLPFSLEEKPVLVIIMSSYVEWLC